ncbi:hypothetical protein DH2020_040106 [Rehmannia glutinosa]|uniref:Membrane-associated kinase regulator-like protein n=1 Tax=Rehmannia glutinosa TaxID=99300 RepID=A0ABR0UTU9_REHGL
MATKNLALHPCPEEEDYIDIELTSSSPSHILCCTSPQTKEFEFQISFTCNENETTTAATTFPADDLFYNGKILPLHLLHTKLEITNLPLEQNHYYYSLPSLPDSKNIVSPSESRRAISDLNSPRKKKSSILGQKLKSSSAFLKSLFTKSVCSEEESTNCGRGGEGLSRGEAFVNKYLRNCRKGPLFEYISYPKNNIAAFMKNFVIEGNNGNNSNNVHRRSFSSAIKRHSPSKCLSSDLSFCFKSNGGHELEFLGKNGSVERSIEAAIAHCKKSLQIFHSMNAIENKVAEIDRS